MIYGRRLKLILNYVHFMFKARTRPVCLPINEPIRGRSFVSYNPLIIGWNLLPKEGKYSNRPLDELIPVLDNKLCKERYRQLGKLTSANQFDNSVLCAGYVEGNWQCMCEIGSPMLQPIPTEDRREFRYYQIGIAISGTECERTNLPAIFTSVQYYIDWIQEKINNP